MTDKQLRRLSRRQLLELMVEQSKRIDELERELTHARTRLETRRIVAQEAGSIAEASLRLNGVFEAAQNAADQYLDNIRAIYEQVKAQAKPAAPQAEKPQEEPKAEAPKAEAPKAEAPAEEKNEQEKD